MKLLICFFNLHKLYICLVGQIMFIITYILCLSSFAFNVTILVQRMYIVFSNMLKMTEPYELERKVWVRGWEELSGLRDPITPEHQKIALAEGRDSFKW